MIISPMVHNVCQTGMYRAILNSADVNWAADHPKSFSFSLKKSGES